MHVVTFRNINIKWEEILCIIFSFFLVAQKLKNVKLIKEKFSFSYCLHISSKFIPPLLLLLLSYNYSETLGLCQSIEIKSTSETLYILLIDFLSINSFGKEDLSVLLSTDPLETLMLSAQQWIIF